MLGIFKKKKEKCKCFICSLQYPIRECVEVKYRYGDDQGEIGIAYMCNTCAAKYTNE